MSRCAMKGPNQTTQRWMRDRDQQPSCRPVPRLSLKLPDDLGTVSRGDLASLFQLDNLTLSCKASMTTAVGAPRAGIELSARLDDLVGLAAIHSKMHRGAGARKLNAMG